MIRCVRCGTAWLARFHADDPYGTPGARPLSMRRPGRPRFERVIEHVDQSFTPRGAKRPGRPEQPAAAARSPWRDLRPPIASGAVRLWSGIAAALVVVVIVTVLALDTSEAPARRSMSVSGPTKYAGLDVRLVKSTVEAVREGYAVSIEGEISNRTEDEIPVPAIRVSLRSHGTERYDWLVEPTATRLDGGGTVIFRSVLAAPPTGVDEVAFSLTERRRTVVGMR